MRKGQAAMEFLMTYGWAILVVLAAIGALAYFGVLSPDRFLPSKCVANPPFSCNQFLVSEAQDVQLEVQNNAGTDIADATWALSTSDGVACTTTTDVTNVSITNGAALAGGLVAWDGGGCTGLTSGDRFNGNYTIRYRKAGEAISHYSTGSIQARVEQ